MPPPLNFTPWQRSSQGLCGSHLNKGDSCLDPYVVCNVNCLCIVSVNIMAASKCLYHGPARAPVCPGARQFRPVSCKSMDGLKSKPLQSPRREKAAVLEQLERIYRDSGVLQGKKDVLLPAKPRAPGPAWEGKPVRVAYQGERGSYCHEAAVRAFQRCDAVPCCSGMESAFKAVESGAVDRAVVPVENSLDGVIDRNYDLMLRHPGVNIVGELLLPINHCLLGVDGMAVKRVVSHPQALDHCRQRLLDTGVEVEAVDNAATAAKFVAENRDFETGVIGSVIAGREFGLRIAEQNMQDDWSNTTRFFVLGKNSAVEPAGDEAGFSLKTTVAFSLEGGAADLYKALSIFAFRDIKVSNIQSRPLRENPVRVVDGGVEGSFKYFGYVFFVDLEGSTADPAVEKGVDRLKQIASFVRVFGSFAEIV